MRYRKLDAAGDMSFGKGQADFHINVPEAPAQAVKTRLALWVGDWFLDLAEGMAWKTKVLGKYTGPTRDVVVRARILGTQGVTAITAYSSNLDRDTRAFSANVSITTVYGETTVKAPL